MMPPGIRASPSQFDRNPIGNGLPGNANCHRINIIRQKPKNKNTSDVRPYWIPMTLWSVEKMYFRQNGNLCPCSS